MILDSMTWYEQVTYGFAYSFHMPLFVAISGYLFYLTRISPVKEDGTRKWSWGEIMKDKLIRLGIPFFVFTIIAMVMKALFPGDMQRPVNISLMTVWNAIIYPGNGPLGELWFVGVLLWMFALSPIWICVLQKKNYAMITGIILVILHFIPVKVDLLCVGLAASYAVWFYAGMAACKWMPEISGGGWIILLVGAIAYGVADVLDLAFIKSFTAIVASYGLALSLDKMVPKIFSSFRNYTYQIFLMGIFAQIAVKMLFRRIEMPHLIAFIVCIVVGLYFPVLVSKIVEVINNKWLCLCIGLKKKV